MKIAFFTEMGFAGKVPRNHPNMRTEFAWMCALDADHYCITHDSTKSVNEYDIGIVIIPKSNPWVSLSAARKKCKRLGVMQEGPNWYFQDLALDKQFHYYNQLAAADFLLCHNEADIHYYRGLFPKKYIETMPSLMITDAIDTHSLILDREKREGTIIGGNFKAWYGGFDSYMIAQRQSPRIYSPSMGQRSQGEEQIPRLIQHPYMEWRKWITQLSKHKIGIHMMRTHAAGTFALNCSYLGIPCIGYEGLDTQSQLHPYTTVNDLSLANEIYDALVNNKDFFEVCAKYTQRAYTERYSEEIFIDITTKKLQKVLDEN